MPADLLDEPSSPLEEPPHVIRLPIGGGLPAESPARELGESPRSPPIDTATEELLRIYSQRQGELGQALAREMPRPIAAAIRAPPVAPARDVQERSNVLYIPKPLASSDVPAKNVLGRNVEISNQAGDVGNVAQEGPEASAFQREVRDLIRRLGEPDRLSLALSLVMAWQHGPLTEHTYRAIVESAEQVPPGPRRWKIASGALMRQLAEAGEAACRTAGLWDDSRGGPQYHRYKQGAKSLARLLAPLGIAWRPEWGRGGTRSNGMTRST
jgi:hypothetical protein